MRTVLNPMKLALVLATTLLLAACAVDSGRIAGVDGSNGGAVPYTGFR
jgi:hypothetical protein